MSRDEQERLRDIKDAIAAIRRHLEQAGETAAAKEDPLLHDALLFQFVVIERGSRRRCGGACGRRGPSAQGYAVAKTTSQPPKANDPASSARFFGSFAALFCGRMSIISSMSRPFATRISRSRLGVCSPVSMRATSD